MKKNLALYWKRQMLRTNFFAIHTQQSIQTLWVTWFIFESSIFHSMCRNFDEIEGNAKNESKQKKKNR